MFRLSQIEPGKTSTGNNDLNKKPSSPALFIVEFFCRLNTFPIEFQWKNYLKQCSTKKDEKKTFTINKLDPASLEQCKRFNCRNIAMNVSLWRLAIAAIIIDIIECCVN